MKNPCCKSFHKQITRLMKLKRWDYKELAKRLNLHRSTVWKWVFWDRCPSKATRDRVLQVLQEEDASP